MSPPAVPRPGASLLALLPLTARYTGRRPYTGRRVLHKRQRPLARRQSVGVVGAGAGAVSTLARMFLASDGYDQPVLARATPLPGLPSTDRPLLPVPT